MRPNRNKPIGPQKYSEEEEKIVKEAAEKSDLPVNSWIRRCAVQNSRRVLGTK